MAEAGTHAGARPAGMTRRQLCAAGLLAAAGAGAGVAWRLEPQAQAEEQPPAEAWAPCPVPCEAGCALRLRHARGALAWVDAAGGAGGAADGAVATAAGGAAGAAAVAGDATEAAGSSDAAAVVAGAPSGRAAVASAGAGAAAQAAAPAPRACQLGRSYRALIDHPDRLTHPLRRVGARGEGRFEEIGWDEAVGQIAQALREAYARRGRDAVCLLSGGSGGFSTADPFAQLLADAGGYVAVRDGRGAALARAAQLMYGDAQVAGSPITQVAPMSLVLAFGWNPAEAGPGGMSACADWVRAQHQAGVEVRLIDCRLPDTGTGHSGSWVPIRPGTDAALVAGMAHHLIENNLVDLGFLHTYCVGFDEQTMPEGFRGRHLSYRDYIMGAGADGVEKTPEWAAGVCGVPARAIRMLADQAAQAKRLFVLQGGGPQGRATGLWGALAIATLPCLLGQVGLPGTSNGLRPRRAFSLPGFPLGDGRAAGDAVAAGGRAIGGPAVEAGGALSSSIPVSALADALAGSDGPDVLVMSGAEGFADAAFAGDARLRAAVSDEGACGLVVGVGAFMGDALRHADIVLPDTLPGERFAQGAGGGAESCLVIGAPVLRVGFERKSSYEAAALVAAKMGLGESLLATCDEEQAARRLYEQARLDEPALPTWKDACAAGVVSLGVPGEPALAAFRAHPATNPLGTPSGKIELFSAALAA